jgi:hypothetical protein
MPRYFRLEEARRLLPEVAPLIAEAVRLKTAHDEVEGELQAVHRQVAVAGGMMVDRARLLDLRARRDAAARQLRSILERVDAIGCQVKDLDIGLIDFPTLYRGQEVCLCWRLGETTIEFWHGAEEGFRGRKPIDAEFMANHRGEAGLV